MQDLKFTTAEDYMNENSQFAKDMDYFDGIASKNFFNTRWSIYSDDETFGFTRMSDKSPFSAGTVIRNRCEVWGYDNSAVVGGNGSWVDVWAACNEAILNAVDSDGNHDHHIFIEGFELLKDGTIGVVTGS